MKQKTLWFSLILFLSAAFSIFLMLIREHKPKETQLPGGVNAFMTQPIYQDYDENGLLHSQLKADLMKHYIRHDSAIFIKPQILIYTDDHIPWHITADYGKSQDGKKTVFLYNHVILHQPSEPDHPEITIYTSELTVYPERSFAETNRKVMIKRPDTTIHGKGITANLKTGIVKLLTQSQGTYNPNENNHNNP